MGFGGVVGDDEDGVVGLGLFSGDEEVVLFAGDLLFQAFRDGAVFCEVDDVGVGGVLLRFEGDHEVVEGGHFFAGGDVGAVPVEGVRIGFDVDGEFGFGGCGAGRGEAFDRELDGYVFCVVASEVDTGRQVLDSRGALAFCDLAVADLPFVGGDLGREVQDGDVRGVAVSHHRGRAGDRYPRARRRIALSHGGRGGEENRDDRGAEHLFSIASLCQSVVSSARSLGGLGLTATRTRVQVQLSLN